MDKVLAAIEILKKNHVGLVMLKISRTYEQYCFLCSYGNDISEKDFYLLKEVLNVKVHV